MFYKLLGFIFVVSLISCSLSAKVEFSSKSSTRDAGNYAVADMSMPYISQPRIEQLQEPRCPHLMSEVRGEYCPEVKQTCLKWLDEDQNPTANKGIGPMRCEEFAQPSICLSETRKHMDFCMSIFEYPGTEGSYPLVGINYYQAKALAEKDGNRLCTKEEFNFAGEGEEMTPYGYGDGFHRDLGELGCNIDKDWIDYNNFPQSSWNDLDAGLNQSIKSDSNSKCKKSNFGIVNLNGNADEILNSEHSKNVILSGGWWGKIRARVRPETDSHGKNFAFYQIGFRECSDLK